MEVEKLSEQKKIQAKLDELQRNNRSLREKVDILQVESKEHEKPWFKNPSIIVSLIAVLVTIVLTSYNIYEQNKDNSEKSIKQKQSSVRVAIANIVEAQKDYLQLSQIVNDNKRNQLDILINSQRQNLIEDAKSMIDELGSAASTSSLLILGYELELISNFKSAFSYYERALNSAGDNILDQVVALRSLASYKMRPNTGFDDLEKGRKYWQQAVDIQKDKKDEHSIFSTGQTYLKWSYAENLLGNKKIALKKLAQSKYFFKLMDIRNPSREDLLQQTSRALEYFLKPITPFNASQMIGKWKLEYLDNTNLPGNIQITLDSYNGRLDVNGEFLDRNGVITQALNGEGIFIGPETIIIKWGGGENNW